MIEDSLWFYVSLVCIYFVLQCNLCDYASLRHYDNGTCRSPMGGLKIYSETMFISMSKDAREEKSHKETIGIGIF